MSTNKTKSGYNGPFIVGDRIKIEIPEDDPEIQLQGFMPRYNNLEGFIIDSLICQINYAYKILLEDGNKIAWIHEEHIKLIKKGLTGENRSKYIEWSKK